MINQKQKVKKVAEALAKYPNSSSLTIASHSGVRSSETKQILEALKKARKVDRLGGTWSLKSNPSRNSTRFNSGSQSNAGTLGIDTDGDLTMGIGGGLGMDLSDGSLTVDIGGGFSIDTGSSFGSDF